MEGSPKIDSLSAGGAGQSGTAGPAVLLSTSNTSSNTPAVIRNTHLAEHPQSSAGGRFLAAPGPPALSVVVHLETLHAARSGNKEAAVTLSSFYILLLFAVCSLLIQPSRGLRSSGRTLLAATFRAAGSETGFKSS